ncbi:MAG: hypothetical protein NTW14_14575 [bacterium]|nr:hypothetical protein [bacterium]
MSVGQSERRKPALNSNSVIQYLESKAETARSRLASGQNLTIQDLRTALDTLLAVRDFRILNIIFRQLPPAALKQPDIAFVLLKFLFLSGNHKQALCIIEDIENQHPDYRDEKYLKLTQRIKQYPPYLSALPTPQILDYSFDVVDSHYSMKMAIHCPACDTEYLEVIGWGMMVLRPSSCPYCLSPRLLSPDFLISVLQKWHRHDGESGFRRIDEEIHNLVAGWHQSQEYPEEGLYRDINLGDLLALPIQRMLVRNMYIEHHVQTARNQS